MKVTCQYSGVRFEIPQFAGSFTDAIHPIFYLSLPKLEKLAAVHCFSSRIESSDEEIHLVACAVVKQLNALGYIKYNHAIPLQSHLSAQFKIGFIQTVFTNYGQLASAASSEEKPSFSIRAWTEAGLEGTSLFAALKDFVSESILEWVAEEKRSTMKRAIAASNARAESVLFDAAAKFVHLSNNEIDSKIKYVRGFLRKFGKLPMGAKHKISNPIGAGNIELGTYWLDMLDIGDDKLFMLPEADIKEFSEHILENCVLGLPIIQFTLDYLKDLTARKQRACSTLSFLASFTSSDSPLYEITAAGSSAHQSVEVVIPPKRESAAEMLARLRGGK